MGNLNDVDDEFDTGDVENFASELIEKMKMHLKKSEQEAAEAKKISDLKIQEVLARVVKAEKELEKVRALPSPLERLGYSKKPQRKHKKSLPPVPGTEHRYLRSYDAYIMTPAYTEYLRRTERPEAPNFEELD
jgi:hypothetical protein